jgi:hypothetical protein
MLTASCRASSLQAFGFAVLVTGTLVYGRGNEEGHRQELREAMAVQVGGWVHNDGWHETWKQGLGATLTVVNSYGGVQTYGDVIHR